MGVHGCRWRTVQGAALREGCRLQVFHSVDGLVRRLPALRWLLADRFVDGKGVQHDVNCWRHLRPLVEDRHGHRWYLRLGRRCSSCEWDGPDGLGHRGRDLQLGHTVDRRHHVSRWLQHHDLFSSKRHWPLRGRRSKLWLRRHDHNQRLLLDANRCLPRQWIRDRCRHDHHRELFVVVCTGVLEC